MGLLHWLRQGDVVAQATALLLLAMSVASWVVIAWKALLMRRAHADVARCMAAFWQAPHLEEARRQVAVFDRETLVLPLALGVIMLGLGMGLTLEDFRRVARYPGATLTGLALLWLAGQRRDKAA